MLRIHQLLLSTALLAGALTLTPQAASSEEGARRAQSLAFPMPSESLTIGGGEDFSLDDLLREFSRVTGERILTGRDTRRALATASPALHEPLTVAPENVYSVVQDILYFHRFVLTDLRREEPRLLAVESLDSAGRASIKAHATFVPAEELSAYEEHSALMIQTVIHLPHLDVRTMGNSMRQLVVDPNTMQLIPIPESNNVILTGFGKQIHGLVKLLRVMDDGAGQAQSLKREQRLESALIGAAERLGLEPAKAKDK